MRTNRPELEYVRTKEFARKLAVSKVTFLKWRKAGVLPAPLPLPGAPRWAKPVVEQFVSSLRSGTAA